ncbi:MAG: putative amidase [Ilumatobacteraceae bacterium]|nr:putative amidase [Ilumatobacteraceae bacterium]
MGAPLAGNVAAMTDTPWLGDACSLVDAFRSGERSPVEELQATYTAIDASELNAFCHTPRELALEAAARADVSLPFGGVPIGVKELDDVEGWPATDACVVFEDRIAQQTSINVQRIRDLGGAVLAGLTTASEFGGVNVTRTVLHGVTRNPWDTAKTPGGSSGGTASAVSGGLVTLGTGGDGGGSIRIPAGFTGLFGLKSTYGRIPRGPRALNGNYTVTVGCLTRSVRDTARWFDVANGYDARDQFSLPRTDGWERELGSHTGELHGLRVAVVPDWGGATVSPAMWDVLDAAADRLIAAAGMMRVNGVDTSLPSMGAAWSISGGIGSYGQLAPYLPECKDVLTPEIRGGVRLTQERYNLEARVKIEARRMELNERMAAIFGEVDLVMTASNPDIAFAAEGPLPSNFGGIEAGAGNNGRLTFPANMHGNPAVSVPAGTVDGLPVGLQIVGRHYAEQLLLDAALLVERNEPWPLVAPSVVARTP